MGDRNESLKWYIGQLLKWRWEGTAWEFAIWLGTVTGDFFFFFCFFVLFCPPTFGTCFCNQANNYWKQFICGWGQPSEKLISKLSIIQRWLLSSELAVPASFPPTLSFHHHDTPGVLVLSHFTDEVLDSVGEWFDQGDKTNLREGGIENLDLKFGAAEMFVRRA